MEIMQELRRKCPPWQPEELPQLKTRLQEVEQKIGKVERKFLFDEIPQALYDKHSKILNSEKEQILAEIARTGKQLSNLQEFIDEAVQIARNLNVLWENGDYKDRQRLQKWVFPEGLDNNHQNDQCRTFRTKAIFGLTSEISHILGQKKKGQISS